MLRALFCFFSVLTAASTYAPAAPRMLGAQDAAIGDFPYMGSLQIDGGGHVCGASIISPAWVITDAWCYLVPLYLPMFSIRVGRARQDQEDVDDVRHTVTQWIHHPRADPEAGDFDFALINVDPPFEFSVNVSAVALPVEDLPTPGGDVGVVAGWGQVEGSDDWATSQLKYAEMTLADDDWCAVLLAGNYTDRQLCAQNEAVALCYYDEGGPLVVDGTLLGVALYSGYPCANPARVATFGRVARVREWIRTVTGV